MKEGCQVVADPNPDPKFIYWIIKDACEWIRRDQGDTSRLLHGEDHCIDLISLGGVYTLFITSNWRGNGVKVPWRTYSGADD